MEFTKSVKGYGSNFQEKFEVHNFPNVGRTSIWTNDFIVIPRIFFKKEMGL